MLLLTVSASVTDQITEAFRDPAILAGIPLALLGSCALNGALREALDAFFAVLGSYTIDDLVAPNPMLGSLLGLEPEIRPGI